MGKKLILTVLKAEGHSADTGAGKFLLVLMGGRAEGLACADPGARTPIGASGNFFFFYLYLCTEGTLWS
jgi:hypothetical protein